MNMNKTIIGKYWKKEVQMSKKSPNSHVLAIGKSGSGKSVEMVKCAFEKYRAGENVLIINWRHSLDPKCFPAKMEKLILNECVHINVAVDGLLLPLFDLQKSSRGEMESDSQAISRITSLLKVAGHLTSSEEEHVKRAVQTVYRQGLYEKEGLRVVAEFLDAQRYKTAHSAASKLAPLCDTNVIRNGNFFESGPHIYDLDLNGMQYDAQIVVIRFLMDYFLRKANTGCYIDEIITIFIDECQNLRFDRDSTMSVFMNESRKLGVSLFMAAPSIMGMTKAERTALLQCGTLLCFQPPEEERLKQAEWLDTADTERMAFDLSRLKVGEFLAKGLFEVDGKIVDKVLKLRSCLEPEFFGADGEKIRADYENTLEKAEISL